MTRPMTNALARHTSWSRKALFFSTSCSDSGAADESSSYPSAIWPTGGVLRARRCSAADAPSRRPVFTEDSRRCPRTPRGKQSWQAKSEAANRSLSWHILTGPHMESARADRPIFDKERNSDSSQAPAKQIRRFDSRDSHALSLCVRTAVGARRARARRSIGWRARIASTVFLTLERPRARSLAPTESPAAAAQTPSPIRLSPAQVAPS